MGISCFCEKKIRKQNIFGFDNIGNSCYMNSFLQILIHCPNFLIELKNFDKNYLANHPLINCIIKLSKKNDKIYLKQLKELMGNIYPDYNSNKQCDSQEFGRRLINQIIEEIKNNSKDNDNYSSFYSENSNNIDPQKKYEKYKNKYQNNEINIEKLFLIDEIIKEKNNFYSNYEIELYFPNDNKKEYYLYDLFDYKYCNKKKKKE